MWVGNFWNNSVCPVEQHLWNNFGRALTHPNYQKPELLASNPNEVWSWDITKLKGPQKWTYYYLYVILDIHSRYVVGWMLAHRESSDLAKDLIQTSVDRQRIEPEQLIIHSDRGPSMASHSVANLLGSLGVTKSHSRPHVSNDNPFSESQFKTMKYRPDFPDRFGCYEDALSFCRSFFAWYNCEHYHSGIGLVTPESLHYGQAPQIVEARKKTLLPWALHRYTPVESINDVNAAPPSTGFSPYQMSSTGSIPGCEGIVSGRICSTPSINNLVVIFSIHSVPLRKFAESPFSRFIHFHHHVNTTSNSVKVNFGNAIIWIVIKVQACYYVITNRIIGS